MDMATFSEISGAVNISIETARAAEQQRDSLLGLVNAGSTGLARAEGLGLIEVSSQDNVVACGSCCHATGTWGCRTAGNDVPSKNDLLAAVA